MSISSCITDLECTKSGNRYDPDQLHNLSDYGAPLWANYDLDQVTRTLTKESLKKRGDSMWRYRELLPVHNDNCVISLGEGWTPLQPVEKLCSHTGMKRLYIKDESLNPTGSFKARGLSAALSAALERGADSFSIPSAGNAAGALSAYAAAAGYPAHVYMPLDTPMAFKVECDYYGADVELIDGLLSECGKIAARESRKNGWFDVSTLKEPYRLEGKKTMGLEIAEQLGWELPDVIIYPTGGGTGLIGMWKAFLELEQMGWIEKQEMPRMVAVQSDGCAPIVKAFHEGREEAEEWYDAETMASGIRVPTAVADFLILRVLRDSGGTALAVSDEEILDYSRIMARYSGIFPAPEGGATLAALEKLRKQNLVDDNERVVLLNTGSGFKYLEAMSGVMDEMKGAVVTT